MTEVITAKHWLPETAEAWNVDGNLRERVLFDLEHSAALSEVHLEIEPAIVMDPAKPDPVKVLGANWIHGDCHGILTPEIFREDLENCLQEFVDTIVQDQLPFQPVRIYKDAEPALGVGFFDFRGDEFPFDLRTLVQFGTWQLTDGEGIAVPTAGFRFWISTLVMPTPDDHDVYVGRDFGKLFDV